MKKTTLILVCCLGLSTQTFAQSKTKSAVLPPALAAIKEADLKKDIFELAGDSFRGRRGGTLDELRAAVWVAKKANEIGLQPAGDDGTYFQFFNINRSQLTSESTFKINNQTIPMWKQVWPTQLINSHLEADVIWLNNLSDTTKKDIKGKVVALNIVAPTPLPVAGMSLWGYRYTFMAIRQESQVLLKRGVAGIILVADAAITESIGFSGYNYEEGSYLIDGMRTPPPAKTPIILVGSSFESVLKQGGTHIQCDFTIENYTYPSVNVIAKAPGLDTKLKNEYVLFSGHHDHDGVGVPVGKDSIWNGADDNASVTVGMLAIARAWKAKPGKRSALFVWHGAEERGLLGSRWYVNHPTVNKNNIVAVLNGDMIGRNNPDSAALLGVIAPHKNSTTLVNTALKANQELTKFKLDFSWDEASHPENWYFRSDHLPYAQAGIPAIFFTTLLHPDYHTPADEPQKIDIHKLAKMTKWMYNTGWMVSQTVKKPALDPK